MRKVSFCWTQQYTTVVRFVQTFRNVYVCLRQNKIHACWFLGTFLAVKSENVNAWPPPLTHTQKYHIFVYILFEEKKSSSIQTDTAAARGSPAIRIEQCVTPRRGTRNERGDIAHSCGGEEFHITTVFLYTPITAPPPTSHSLVRVS